MLHGESRTPRTKRPYHERRPANVVPMHGVFPRISAGINPAAHEWRQIMVNDAFPPW
jgi:hypothetical protein